MPRPLFFVLMLLRISSHTAAYIYAVPALMDNHPLLALLVACTTLVGVTLEVSVTLPRELAKSRV